MADINNMNNEKNFPWERKLLYKSAASNVSDKYHDGSTEV